MSQKIVTNYSVLQIALVVILSSVLLACTQSQYNEEQQKLLSTYKFGIENRGKLYFQQVCSNCHRNNYNIQVPPHQYTMTQWHKYLRNNLHEIKGGNQSLSHFFSKAYRANLAKSNEEIELVVDVNDNELRIDVAKYLLNGAKDADSPKSCSQ